MSSYPPTQPPNLLPCVLQVLRYEDVGWLRLPFASSGAGWDPPCYSVHLCTIVGQTFGVPLVSDTWGRMSDGWFVFVGGLPA